MPDATATDAFGDLWRVTEARPTGHGFPVLLGRPVIPHRGGAAVILTPPLAAHLERHRSAPAQVDLPIGMTAVKRLRRLLGHNRYIDARAWWEARIEDLADLPPAEFAARHGRKEHTVRVVRLALLGRKLRPAGWWREPDAAELLAGDLPRAYVADLLGISVGAVGRLRWVLRSAAAQDPAHWTDRPA